MTPPVRRAANKNAATTVPSGAALPSKATVIASKPSEPPIPLVNACSVPRTCTAPPNPASAPHKTIVRVVTNGIEIPADLAAFALDPTALNLNPKVLFASSHQTNSAASKAINIPA